MTALIRLVMVDVEIAVSLRFNALCRPAAPDRRSAKQRQGRGACARLFDVIEGLAAWRPDGPRAVVTEDGLAQ